MGERDTVRTERQKRTKWNLPKNNDNEKIPMAQKNYHHQKY